MKDKGYPREFYYLVASSFMIYLALESTRPILPLYITEKGASAFELGIVIGIFSICTMIAKMPLGKVTELMKRKYVLIFAAVGQSASQLLYSIASSPEWFYPIRILHAVTMAPLFPVAFTISQEMAPRNRSGDATGKITAAYGLGTMVGPFLCSFLLSFMGYDQLFQAVAIFPILGLFLLFGVGEEKQVARTSGTTEGSSASFLNHLRRSRNLKVLAYLRFSHSLAYAFFLTFFVIYAENTLAIAPALIAFLFGVKGTADLMLRIPAGKMGDRWNYKWMLATAFAALSLFYLLISEAEKIPLLIGLMVLLGLAISLRVVSEYVVLSESSSAKTRNMAASYLSTVFYVGSSCGAILAGVLASYLPIPIIFKGASVLLATGLIGVVFLKRPDKSWNADNL